MHKVLQYSGLAIITVVAAIFGFIIIGGFVDSPALPADAESWGMAVLSILTILSAVVCWVLRKTGDWMAIGAGVLFTIFALLTAGQKQWMAVLATGFPLILGGGLILLGLRPKK